MNETRPTAFDPYWEWLQIPPDRRPPNHYELLGVATLEQDVERIRAVSMNRIASVRRYQIGQHGDAAIRLLGELSRAFDCLTTPARKADYDRQFPGARTSAKAAVEQRPPKQSKPPRSSPPPFNGRIGPAESYPVSGPPPVDDVRNPFVAQRTANDAPLPVVVPVVVPEYVADGSPAPYPPQPPRKPGPLAALFTEYLWVTLAIVAAICTLVALPFLIKRDRRMPARPPVTHSTASLPPVEPSPPRYSETPQPNVEPSSVPPPDDPPQSPTPESSPEPFPPSAEFVARDRLAPHSAEQITGPPDVPTYGESALAWTSESPDGAREWLIAEFAEPVIGRRLIVHQSFNPGAIASVEMYDDRFKLEPVWRNDSIQSQGARLTPLELPLSGRSVHRVRLELDSKAIPGSNQIDALELVDEAGRSHWAAWAMSSGNYQESADTAKVRARQAAELSLRETAILKSTGAAAEPSPRGLVGEALLVDSWGRARCGDKYGMLLERFEKRDAAAKGEFQEAGYRQVGGHPPGYWVYVAPNWHIWRDGPETSFNTSAGWTAWQATGPPNVDKLGDNKNAWAPELPDEPAEWLSLEYAQPIRAQTVTVYESSIPGAIVKAVVITLDGSERPANLAGAVKNAGLPVQSNFKVATSSLIVGVKVYLDSKRLRGFNQIDAVKVVDDKGGEHYAVSAEASSSFGGKYATIGARSERLPEVKPPSTTADWDARLLALERSAIALATRDSGDVGKALSGVVAGEPTADLIEARLRRLKAAVRQLGLSPSTEKRNP